MVVLQNNHLVLSLSPVSPPPNQKFYVDLHEMTYETADVQQCTCPKITNWISDLSISTSNNARAARAC